MKNSKLLIFTFLSMALFMSCEEDKVTFDGGQTLVTLHQTSIDLPVTIDDTGSVEVQVDATTTSGQDRVFNIAVVADETTADPATYTVPATVTIPANSYTGTFTITGVDIGVETIPETITIEMTTDNPNILIERNVGVVSIFQVCPIPTDFLVGEYMIEDEQATLGPLFTTPGPNIEPATVTISEGNTPSQRIFTIKTLPAIGGDNAQVVLNLLCGEFMISGEVNTGVFCSFVDPDQTIPNYVVYKSASDGGFVNSTYDTENELDTYVINYTDDANTSCLSSSALSSFRLTKIN